ncbi:MAG: hypothetical protein FWE67_13200 [Planctomycetaceae bacterium]|nr:hypothetical protein [Planctomycetaceae bacterium]
MFGTQAAFARINTAREILEIVRTRQAVQGSADYPDGVVEEFDAMIPLLCEAGLAREIDATEGAFRFRITWKGLCFLDTAYILAESFDSIKDDGDVRLIVARLTAAAFH